MNDTDEKILKAVTELTQKVDRIEAGQKAMQQDIKTLQNGQNTAELKMEAFHAEQRQANKEIVVTLHEMHQVDTEDTNRRLERIEKHLNLPPLK